MVTPQQHIFLDTCNCNTNIPTTNPKFRKTSHSVTSPYCSKYGLKSSPLVSDERLPTKILIGIAACASTEINKNGNFSFGCHM